MRPVRAALLAYMILFGGAVLALILHGLGVIK